MGLFHYISRQQAIGLAVLRLVAGVILLNAGLGKITGGYAVGFFTNIGIPLPMIMGPFVSLLETVGGAALIAGLFVRPLGFLFAGQFMVAAWINFSGRGLAAAQLDLLLLAVGVLLLTHGAGSLSVDALLGRRRAG